MCAVQGCDEPAEFAGICRKHRLNLASLLANGPQPARVHPEQSADAGMSDRDGISRPHGYHGKLV